MTTLIHQILCRPRNAFAAFAVFAAAALCTAFTSQYVYGLQPCELCVYQRIPYAVIIALGLAGAFVAERKPHAGAILMALTALSYAANAVIAFYHTGVERKWWASFLEGCTIPNMEGNITDVLAQIAKTPAVRCDEIPWTDPVLGLSMANYNVIVCLAMAAAALYSLRCRTSSQNPVRP